MGWYYKTGGRGRGKCCFTPMKKRGGGGGAENVLVILIGAQKVTLPCCE